MPLQDNDLQSIDRSQYDIPGRGYGLLDVFRWRFLLKLLVRKETSTRYRNSVLGWAWSYVRPAAQFTVFYLVLGVFLKMNKGIENFPLYLFSGIILINFFSEGFSNATKSLVDNAHLVRKIYLPRELFPVATVIVSFVHFLPQLLLLTAICLFFGWLPLPVSIGAALLGALLVALFSTGLGLFFGSLNVPFRDAQNFVELILLFATWASPVLYSWTMVRDALPEWLFNLYLLNPLTIAVELFHVAFWSPITAQGHPPLPNFPMHIGIASVFVLLVLFIGQLVFRKLEPRFAQDL